MISSAISMSNLGEISSDPGDLSALSIVMHLRNLSSSILIRSKMGAESSRLLTGRMFDKSSFVKIDAKKTVEFF